MTSRLWTALACAASLAGLLIVVLFHDRGIPIASIDFTVLRPGAESAARAFLLAERIDLTGYTSAVSFETDTDAQGYVEREAGQAALNRIAAQEVTIWRWRVRFFKELDPLEYAVSVSPAGAVTGWTRTLAEAAPGASLSEEAAKAIAERQLRRIPSGSAPFIPFPAVPGGWAVAWEPAGAAREVRPNRVDYRFTWERSGYAIAEATHRRSIVVQGDQVGGDTDFLRVPEKWVREQRIETNRGIVLANAGWTLTYALVLGALLAFLQQWRLGRTAWRLPAALAGAFLAVGAMALVNQMPVFLASYPTTATISGFLLEQVRDQVSLVGPQLVAVYVTAVAGFALWPLAFPSLPDPAQDLSPVGWRSRRFVHGILIGYIASGLWLGYFTLYYWAGTNWFGVWSPVELPYRDVMSGAFPAAFPLFVGAGAAIAEETIFRLFAIPAGVLAVRWLWRRVRRKEPTVAVDRILLVLVVVVVAVVWGSLHSTYPQRPFFVRALEVSLIGVTAGFVLIRFGIVATMATHYIGNTAIVGALFILSGNRDLQVVSAIVTAAPLALLLPAVLARLRPAKAAPVTGRAVAVTAEPDARPVMVGPQHPIESALSFTRVVTMLGLAVPVLALAVLVRQPEPAAWLRWSVGRAEAEAAAGGLLNRLGLAGPDWIVLSSAIDMAAGPETTYLVRETGPVQAAQFYAGTLPAAQWQVRYTKPLQKDEVWVQIDPRGQVIGFTRLVDEAAPGDSPSLDQARLQAEQLLAAFAGVRGQWEPVSSAQIKRDRRLDSVFTWRLHGSEIAGAELRAQAGLLGSEPGSLRLYLKIPDAFSRDLAKETTLESGVQAARDLLAAGLTLAVGWHFLRRLRRGQLNVRAGAVIAVAVALAWAVQQAASFPVLLAGYRNTLDLVSFAVLQVSVRLRDAMLVIAVGGGAGALLPARRDESGKVSAFTVLTALAWLAALAGLAEGVRLAMVPRTFIASGMLPPVDAAVPGLALAAAAVQTGLVNGVIMLAALQVLTGSRGWTLRRLALVAVTGAVLVAADGRGETDIAVRAVLGASLALAGYLVWAALGRPTVALLGAAVLGLILPAAYRLAVSGTEYPWLGVNSVIALAVGAAAVWWLGSKGLK